MKNTIEPHKSSIGDIQANIMALLCYLVGSVLAFIPVIRYVAWLVPLVIIFMEKENKFIKFHAMQSFALNATGVILGLIVSLLFRGIFAATAINSYVAAANAFGAVAFVGMLTTLISLVILVFSIIAMIKAYKYIEYRIPLIGGIAAKLMRVIKP